MPVQAKCDEKRQVVKFGLCVRRAMPDQSSQNPKRDTVVGRSEPIKEAGS